MKSKFQAAKQQAKNLTKEQEKAFEDLGNIYLDYCKKEGKKPTLKGLRKFCKEIKKELNKQNEEANNNNNEC